jgi:hypothetical protein
MQVPPEQNEGHSPFQFEGAAGLTHTAPSETVLINKYHLVLAIRRIMEHRRGPTWEQVVSPLALSLGLLVALIPTDFKDYAGIPADTWQAVVVMAIVLAGVWFLILLGQAIWCLFKYPPKSDVDYYADIIREMEEDRERIGQIGTQTQG